MKKGRRPVHRFMLHIPEELWEPLQELAERNRCSVTSLVVYTINREIQESGIEWEEPVEPTKSP